MPLFQNEGRCSAFDMEIIFHSHANKTRFHKKGCAPSLILKVRVLELGSGLLTNTRLRRGFKLFPLQRSSLAINQRINKGITVTTVTLTYGNIWFYNKWIFQGFFLCSHRHGYRFECEIELLVHNTDCTLTIETTGQNPIHRSLKTGITGFYGCVSKYVYWIFSGSIEVSG